MLVRILFAVCILSVMGVLERFFDFLCEALPVRFVVVGVCGLVLVKLVVGFSVHCYDDGEVVRGQFVQGGPGSVSVHVVRGRGDACCWLLFVGFLVGVSVFSEMWFEF